MTVDLSPSLPSPQPLGTILTWTATAPDANSGTLWYRFRVRRIGEDAHTIRDYGPPNTLDWTIADREGMYEMEVSVRNLDSGEQSSATALFEMTSLVTGGAPVITATSNPLVFIYSAPACARDSRMRVDFQTADGFAQSTGYRSCDPSSTMNFYLAGLRANTAYAVRHTIDTGTQFVTGPALSMHTNDFSLSLAPYTVLQPPQAPVTNGVLLQSSLGQPIVATDLYGNLLWYSAAGVNVLTDTEPGGRFLGILTDYKVDTAHQVVKEFDLMSITTRETNAARVSEQLVALGMRPITAFHHDARRLPDGNILVLAAVEQILTDVQGPGPVDVLGDMILVLGPDLQVVWAWNSFDHLDPGRPAVLGETCQIGGGGCAPFSLAAQANDWLHGNSIQLTPDGNILYSARHQDWLIKIDYANGEGTGNILWRLGKDGDFNFSSSDPYPWFSHQHDANFLPGDNSTISVFDNGNTRHAQDSTANSRGQVIQLDEANRVASLVLNADMGVYSVALGTARLMSNGDFEFLAGWIVPSDPTQPSTSLSVEVDSSGQIVYSLEAATQVYRTFQMRSMYTRE